MGISVVDMKRLTLHQILSKRTVELDDEGNYHFANVHHLLP